jgi:hypothetical protein
VACSATRFGIDPVALDVDIANHAGEAEQFSADAVPDCERAELESNEGSMTQTGPALTRNGCMLFWALLASGQITMRKGDGWQTLPTWSLTSPLDPLTLNPPETPSRHFPSCSREYEAKRKD